MWGDEGVGMPRNSQCGEIRGLECLGIVSVGR